MQKIPQKQNQSQEETNSRKLELEALPLENQYPRSRWLKHHGAAMKTDTKVGGQIEIPEINLHIYSQLVLNKDTKNTHWRRDSTFINHTENIKQPRAQNDQKPPAFILLQQSAQNRWNT